MPKPIKQDSGLSGRDKNAIIRGSQDFLIRLVGDNVKDRVWRVILIAAISITGALFMDSSPAHTVQDAPAPITVTN